jgi:hypothetical protein
MKPNDVDQGHEPPSAPATANDPTGNPPHFDVVVASLSPEGRPGKRQRITAPGCESNPSPVSHTQDLQAAQSAKFQEAVVAKADGKMTDLEALLQECNKQQGSASTEIVGTKTLLEAYVDSRLATARMEWEKELDEKVAELERKLERELEKRTDEKIAEFETKLKRNMLRVWDKR